MTQCQTATESGRKNDGRTIASDIRYDNFLKFLIYNQDEIIVNDGRHAQTKGDMLKKSFQLPPHPRALYSRHFDNFLN